MIFDNSGGTWQCYGNTFDLVLNSRSSDKKAYFYIG